MCYWLQITEYPNKVSCYLRGIISSEFYESCHHRDIIHFVYEVNIKKQSNPSLFSTPHNLIADTISQIGLTNSILHSGGYPDKLKGYYHR